MIEDSKQPAVLTIAGFDPSGGAGIIADVKNHSSFWLPAAGRYYLADLSKLSKCFRSDSSECRVAAVAGSADRREVRIAAVKIGMLPTSRDRFGSREPRA